MKVRATELLCKVTTEEEVKEYCAAFMQLYREEARYLERTAPWIERVGLSYIKDRIVNDESARKNFARKFLESQQYAQVDPWAQQARAKNQREFIPIKPIHCSPEQAVKEV